MKEIFNQTLSKAQAQEQSLITLAFVGDGVHTLYVRNLLITIHNVQVGKLHNFSSKYCCAEYQAKQIDLIFDELNAEEQDIVHRARNAKVANHSKNADLLTYKKATSYEALLGYLWLIGERERLIFILEKTNEVKL